MGDGWKPISEAQPIEWIETFLVARDEGKRAVMPCVWDGECWRALTIAGMVEFDSPTHWQPLPEPPEAP